METQEWKDMVDKSNEEAKEWMKSNKAHLEKLDDWLNTPVKIVEMDRHGETYDGDIRELIGRVVRAGTSIWVCSFIEKIINGETVDLEQLIDDTVLPNHRVYGPGPLPVEMSVKVPGILIDTFDESKKQKMYVATVIGDFDAQKSNLITLCKQIMELDKDKLPALNAMLCSEKLIRSTAWSMLVKEKRRDQGYVPSYERKDDKDYKTDVGPWIRPLVKSVSSGGKRTKRHKRSDKRSNKRSGKRSNKKRSGHKRSGHKRSGKRSGKR